MNDKVILLMNNIRTILGEYVVVMTDTYDEGLYDKYMESFIELSVYMREIYHENDSFNVSDVEVCDECKIEEEYLLFREMYDKLEH